MWNFSGKVGSTPPYEARMRLDDAFANAAYIPDGAAFPARWAAEAAVFRDRMVAAERAELNVAYGPSEREVYDLFHPHGPAKGTVVFVHGGYWLRFHRSDWSHFAKGALDAGWRVAMPSYTLCPAARISEITVQIEAAIGAIAAACEGPLRLTGHSAGGHLVARMVCDDREPAWRHRVEKVVPISPVTDLAPLQLTSMNADLQLTPEEAEAESPVCHSGTGVPVHIWVGADERPVFLQQADALAHRWQVPMTVDTGKHHFDVIDGLLGPSPLLQALLG